jgi:hypothetical protein
MLLLVVPALQTLFLSKDAELTDSALGPAVE